MEEEQLYGREATEAAQGYTPMPEPVADKPDHELEHAQAIERIIDRDPPSPIVERKYVRADDDSKPQPDNRTIALDQAARDLAENRESEEAVRAIERDLELANKIDEARGLRPDLQPAAEQQTQPEAQQQQPGPQQPTDVDPGLRAALQNPAVLSMLEQHHLENVARVEAAETAASTRTEQAVNFAVQFAEHNAEIAASALLSHPMLRGVRASDLPAAIQVLSQSNPEAAVQIQQQLAHVKALSDQAMQAKQVQQQRQTQQFQQAAQQHDAEFDRLSAASGETPEQRDAVARYAHKMLKDSGLSDEFISHHWNNNPLLRSVQGQQILHDAAAFRMAKAGVAQGSPRSRCRR